MLTFARRGTCAFILLAACPGDPGTTTGTTDAGDTTALTVDGTGLTGSGESTAADGTTAGSSTGGESSTGEPGSESSTGEPPGECAVDADCEALFGPAMCGTWHCDPGTSSCVADDAACSDADGDGFVVGEGCEGCGAGLDCDDGDAAITTDGLVACYSGPPGTVDVGVCHGGTRQCIAGEIGPCMGEMVPSAETCDAKDDDCDGEVDEDLGEFHCGLGACAAAVPACVDGVLGECAAGPPAAANDASCNEIDDDCDGAIDENCAACVKVAPWGDDSIADGSANNPFAGIQAAIDWAVEHDGTRVCVAQSVGCGGGPAVAEYVSAPGTTVTMAEGVHVLGNYAWSNWTRCPGGAPHRTGIVVGTPEGVVFPADVQATTVLDGFVVTPMSAAPTSAAVTVDGAKGAMIVDIGLPATAVTGTTFYGVNVINGGDATVARSVLRYFGKPKEAAAVRAAGARVTVQDNCAAAQAVFCESVDLGLGCTYSALFGGAAERGYGVLLQDAPGSIVRKTSICHGTGAAGAGVRIEGDGTGVQIHRSLIQASQDPVAIHGVWTEGCAGASPWIVDNTIAPYAQSGDAVRSLGDCHPRIESNRLVGSASGSAATCAAKDGVASQCAITRNDVAVTGTGVRCADAGCLRVEHNEFGDGYGSAPATVGLHIEQAGPLVAANRFRGTCSLDVTGLLAEDAWSRVENNVLTAAFTNCGTVPQSSTGMRVLSGAGPREVDVHSNTIDAGGTPMQCRGRAVELGVLGEPPTGGLGVWRNNILRAGVCGLSRIGLVELDPAADPRIFEHNNLDPAGAPSGLYLDENVDPLMTAAEVDALADTTAAGTLSVNAQLVAPPTDMHLQPGSACVDAGTPVGAPTQDHDGEPRDATPDIGAYEL